MDGEGLMQQLPSSISREATCFWLDFWLSQANAMDQCNRGMRLAQSSCWPGEIQFQVPVLALSSSLALSRVLCHPQRPAGRRMGIFGSWGTQPGSPYHPSLAM